jgi:hypothetical protein
LTASVVKIYSKTAGAELVLWQIHIAYCCGFGLYALFCLVIIVYFLYQIREMEKRTQEQGKSVELNGSACNLLALFYLFTSIFEFVNFVTLCVNRKGNDWVWRYLWISFFFAGQITICYSIVKINFPKSYLLY